MMLELFSHVTLYSSIVLTSFLLHNDRKYHYLGIFFVAISLQLFDLPDIQEYKKHYDLSASIGFNIIHLYNFELGYVFLTVLASKFVIFEVFWSLIIFFALSVYSRLFKLGHDGKAYIYMLIFLSLCLYFISFTLRTTLASSFCALSICFMKGRKNFFAFLLVLVGISFHASAVPFLLMPLMNISIWNTKKSLIDSYFPFVLAILITLGLFASQIPLIDYIAQLNDFAKFKIESYEGSNTGSKALFFHLWVFVLLILILKYKNLSRFDRQIIITYFLIFFSMNNLLFFQGRFMWLTSFLFAYFIVKVIKIQLFIKHKNARIMFILVMPILTLFHF